MDKPFLFSVPTGEPVSLDPFHYAIVGQTQFSGKTTLIKRLSTWIADEGYRVLIFDTKETEADYADFGREVPICLREATDSFVLIGLLESMFRRRLTRYYSTLTRITEGAKGFNDIISNARELEAKTKSGWLRDAYRILYDLIERLQAETAKVKTVPALKLHDGINRMVINEFSLEAQQLIIKNAFEDALRKYKQRLVLVLDEAFKFLPQGYSSPATKTVMQVITQGAKTGLFTWISTQFLATTDKDPLKACAIKFLGTQDHITEVKHTLDLIPEVRGKFSSDDIMKLKLGHWILVRKRPPDVRIVYATPVGVPGGVGRQVACKELTAESIRDKYLKKLEVDEDLWKKKYETLKKEFDLIQTTLRKLGEKYDKLKAKYLELQTSSETQGKKIQGPYVSTVELEETPELPPSEIEVTIEQPKLSITVERKALSLTDENPEGRVAIVYAEGELPSDKWFSTKHVNAAFTAHGWPQNKRIGKVLDRFCQWGFFRKQISGFRPEYRVELDPEEAKARGLLKTEEVIA